MGCRGCYGPLDGIEDQGARMVGALAAVLRVGSPDDAAPALAARLSAVADALVDPVGTLYRHGLAHALLARRPPPDGSPAR